MPSPISASSANLPAVRLERPLNPAQQARAADPAAKGAAFGALVSGFAKAKHTPPVVPASAAPEPSPPSGTSSAVNTTA